MNLWLISKYAGLPKYGLGARLFFLAREFARLGHKVVLVTSDANHFVQFPATSYRYNYEEVDGVPVCWIKTRKYSHTASVGRVLSWLSFEWRLLRMPTADLPRPDAIVVSSLSLLSVLNGYRLKRRFGVPLVFEVRDIWPLTMVEEGGFHRWHPLVQALGMVERFGYRHADLVVGTMPALDLHVREILGRDKPFFCSPLGYCPEWEAEDTPLPEDFASGVVPPGKCIVGYAGSMGISNALEPLMRAAEALEHRDDIHFLLVGSGDMKQRYMDRMAGRKNVTFVPRIKKTEVSSFLRMCDVLYLSAHNSAVWRFGQSLNKLIDYMLSGRPVIASYSGYPSMLDESGCGFFVPAADARALTSAIVEISRMPRQEREAMGARGRSWLIENRRYSRLGREYLEVLNGLINKGPRP